MVPVGAAAATAFLASLWWADFELVVELAVELDDAVALAAVEFLVTKDSIYMAYT